MARLPRPIAKLTLPVATYIGRLRLWWCVRSELKFVSSPSGRNSLVRSFLFAPISALRGLSAFQNLVLLEDATVAVEGIGRFHLRAHTDDLYVALPSSEREVLTSIASQLKPGEVFVDAGANIGVYTVLASKIVGPGGAVVSIEMMPETFGRLRSHVELNDCHNVTLVNKALSDRAGGSTKATMPADGRHGKASIVVEHAGVNDRLVEVETETLENILAPFSHIRLMKMDLEGAESLAIEGARGMLDRVDAIIFESWDEQHDATTLLQERGFRVRRLDGRNCIAQKPSAAAAAQSAGRRT